MRSRGRLLHSPKLKEMAWSPGDLGSHRLLPPLPTAGSRLTKGAGRQSRPGKRSLKAGRLRNLLGKRLAEPGVPGSAGDGRVALCLGSASAWLSTALSRCQVGWGRLCVIEKPGLACVVAKRSTKGQSSHQRVPTGRLWPPAKLACFKSDVLTPEGPAPLEGDGGGAGVGVGLGAQRGASQTW